MRNEELIRRRLSFWDMVSGTRDAVFLSELFPRAVIPRQ